MVDDDGTFKCQDCAGIKRAYRIRGALVMRLRAGLQMQGIEMDRMRPIAELAAPEYREQYDFAWLEEVHAEIGRLLRLTEKDLEKEM